MTSDPLTVTFVDAAYLPLLRIWLPRLRELGVTRVQVFCLDDITYDWCVSQGVAAEVLDWSGNLRDLWVQRIRIFSALLAAGEAFVHSDIDAIWIRNPLRRARPAAATRTWYSARGLCGRPTSMTNGASYCAAVGFARGRRWPARRSSRAWSWMCGPPAMTRSR